MTSISLRVEFGGGLELLFGNEKKHKITLPAQAPANHHTKNDPQNGDTKAADMDFLIHWLRDHLLKERAELFMENKTVRPGILVLINDTDWELEGEGEYQLKDDDEIVFISTLHGG
ncbi:Ubiquitin-related modifier 1 [Marasmius crinis-equi]|uniref:Ubiquitin-related modifier 1 n=1 Tax=Marasmius crinis-equi TaxID=585013 RepID=A0ABR3G1G2_9AGAR